MHYFEGVNEKLVGFASWTKLFDHVQVAWLHLDWTNESHHPRLASHMVFPPASSHPSPLGQASPALTSRTFLASAFLAFRQFLPSAEWIAPIGCNMDLLLSCCYYCYCCYYCHCHYYRWFLYVCACSLHHYYYELQHQPCWLVMVVFHMEMESFAIACVFFCLILDMARPMRK